MAAVPGFLLRLNTETGRLLQQQDRQGRPIRHWQVVLLLPEEQLPACSKAISAEAAGTSLDAEIDDLITAILVSRFSGRTVAEICAMGGITVDDFTSSVAYREIFGLGPPGRPPGGPPDRSRWHLPPLARAPLRHSDPQPTGPHPSALP
jgi:hypothetical protein